MMTVHVGLSAWIIQDGNYEDFTTGRTYRFALEFYPRDLVVRADGSADSFLSHRSGAVHRARGTLMFRTTSVWVLDFGVPAFQEATPPEQLRVGDSVSGEFYIGVDPFFYFEYLRHESGMPDLFRNWYVDRILLETTPWLESTDGTGRRVMTRDGSRESFMAVRATDAWHHDDGHGHYVLECKLRQDAAV